MLADKLQQAEIQLDPLGLGKMKIQIQMDASSQASVHFVVQHGQTREMLEQAMPRLRDMLAGQGIQPRPDRGATTGAAASLPAAGQSSSQGQSGFGDQGRQGKWRRQRWQRGRGERSQPHAAGGIGKRCRNRFLCLMHS